MAAISIFDIFKIGIGPSSSHTGGPMMAAYEFTQQLDAIADQVTRIQVTLYGSLAFTGKGHGTDSAIILGLMGLRPATIDPDAVEAILRSVHADKEITIPAVGSIPFDPENDLTFNYDTYSPTAKIIPRAVEFLDYTEGGVDIDAFSALNDRGGADEIHGEAGDDTIYGQRGNDAIFGDGQSDDLIGGTGNDWISGGTGSDGVIGDDGRIMTSRNSTAYGEALNGVAPLEEVNRVAARIYQPDELHFMVVGRPDGVASTK